MSNPRAFVTLPVVSLTLAILISCSPVVGQGVAAQGAAGQGQQGQGAPASIQETTLPGFGTPRLVFSGTKALTTAPQTASFQNTSGLPLTVTALSLKGPGANAFTLLSPPVLPLTLTPGQSLSLSVAFNPQGQVGVLQASLTLTSGTAAERPSVLQLSGLSTQYEQSEGEPPLAQVVQALGYGMDVGGQQLLLGTSTPLLGQEVAAPLFRKLGSGPVTLRPVARYSPDDLLTFGFFTLRGGQPVLSPVGVVATHQEQTLNPALASGGAAFDPGTEPFGLYVGPTGYSATGDYTLDSLNAGPTRHAIRVYPLRDEAGAALPGYLLAIEASSNGDYQDAVFVLTGAEPAPAAP